LPGRSPFRQAPFKSEIVENPQQPPEAAPAKGNAASRFLTNLWPGNKTASTPVSSAEAGAKSEKPPIKRILDGIQFWKN
jgi:hypothetical protein